MLNEIHPTWFAGKVVPKHPVFPGVELLRSHALPTPWLSAAKGSRHPCGPSKLIATTSCLRAKLSMASPSPRGVIARDPGHLIAPGHTRAAKSPPPGSATVADP